MPDVAASERDPPCGRNLPVLAGTSISAAEPHQAASSDEAGLSFPEALAALAHWSCMLCASLMATMQRFRRSRNDQAAPSVVMSWTMNRFEMFFCSGSDTE